MGVQFAFDILAKIIQISEVKEEVRGITHGKSYTFL
jgi:hypothetical protein